MLAPEDWHRGSEFTPEAGDGRVNFYAGVNGSAQFDPTVNAGAMFPAVEPWWDSLENLKKYDMIIHSCEGTEYPTNKSPAATRGADGLRRHRWPRLRLALAQLLVRVRPAALHVDGQLQPPRGSGRPR